MSIRLNSNFQLMDIDRGSESRLATNSSVVSANARSIGRNSFLQFFDLLPVGRSLTAIAHAHGSRPPNPSPASCPFTPRCDCSAVLLGADIGHVCPRTIPRIRLMIMTPARYSQSLQHLISRTFPRKVSLNRSGPKTSPVAQNRPLYG